MLALLADHESRLISTHDFEKAIEFHMQALDSIDLATIRNARDLTYRLVTSDFTDGDEVFSSNIDAATVRADFRKFLATLPGA